MIYFIVNKQSRTGKGALIWREIRTILKEKGISYKSFYTEYKGHATKLAKNLSSNLKEEIKLVVVGGDGTVNEVINGIVDFEKVCFGIIPTGSGNDFARGLGIKGDIRQHVERIISGKQIERIDLGCVSYGDNKSRYYGISSGIGMDAIVCKKALNSKLKTFLNRFHIGKLTYLILTIQTLFSMETAKVKVRFDNKTIKSFNRLIFCAAMNFRAEGGGVPMAPRADAKDGKLSLCFAHGIPKWKTFFMLPLLVLAKHEKLSCFYITECKTCEIKLSKPVVAHADGEYLGDVSSIFYECLPGKLKIIIQ